MSKQNRMARLEGKVDLILTYQQRAEKRWDGHDKRLRSLENDRSKIIGWSACAGTFITFVVTSAISYIKGGG